MLSNIQRPNVCSLKSNFCLKYIRKKVYAGFNVRNVAHRLYCTFPVDFVLLKSASRQEYFHFTL
jgi:hypothetical protein